MIKYNELVERAVIDNLNCKISNITKVGNGAVGSVFKVVCDGEPKMLAVKISNNYDLMLKEAGNIQFINDRVDVGMPKIYFLDKIEDYGIMGMQFLDGVGADKLKLTFKPKKLKQKLCLEVVENLERLQSICNDKYGRIDDAVYDNWHDYYRPFAQKVLDFTKCDVEKGKFLSKVYEVMCTAMENYDKIFDEPISPPTLMHGDYWSPNIIVNPNTLDFVGLVDPFNLIWADKEYELFALVACKLKGCDFYKLYKSRNTVSEKCDLKIEFYALFSEVYWYSLTGNKYDGFMLMKAKYLKKQMHRFGIIK